jgi:hypothetical protein
MGRITFDTSNPTGQRKTHKMTFQILSFIILVSITGLMAGSYFVPQFLEQPSHIVLEREGKFEIRQYENILLSSVKISGDQYSALRNGFKPLAGYIGAKEREGIKISMTAPVIQSSGDVENEWVVSFSMPSKYNKVSLPDPKNDQVYTEEMMQTTAAVLRFSGNANQQLLDKKTALLLKWVETSGYKISSKPKYLFYNPPATPGFLKRNEVMLVVNSEKTDD